MRRRTFLGRARLRSTVIRQKLQTSFGAVARLDRESSRYRQPDIHRGSLSRRPSCHRAPTAFVDPRNIVATVGSPTRLERSVPLKALVSQINYNLFDMEVGAQQSQFAFLQAKDLADSVEGLLRTHDVALWNGNDTSLSAPP